MGGQRARARTLHGRGSRVGNVGIAHNVDCSVARGQPTLITPLILPRMHVWYFHVYKMLEIWFARVGPQIFTLIQNT